MKFADQLMRFLAPISGRIRNMVARAVISTINDDPKIQQMCIKLLTGEMQDKIERFQNYGITSHPHPNMEAAVVFINGNRENPIIVAVGDRTYRVKGLQQGEVCIYTDEGDKITLKRDRNIQIDTRVLTANAIDEINYNTTNINVNASGDVDVTVDGKATVTVKGNVDLVCSQNINIGDPETLEAMMRGEWFMKNVYNLQTHTVLGIPTTIPNVLMMKTDLSAKIKNS